MDVREHRHEADRLASLRSQGLLDSDPDEVLEALTLAAADACGAPISLITLVDADHVWFLSRHGVDQQESPRTESLCSDTVAAGKALVLPDLTRVPRYAGLPSVAAPGGYRAYAGVPLDDRDGLPLGSLCVLDTRPRDFTPDQLAALRDLARAVVAALDERRTERETQVTRTRSESHNDGEMSFAHLG